MRYPFIFHVILLALCANAVAELKPDSEYKAADMVFGPVSEKDDKEEAWQIRPYRSTGFSQVSVTDSEGKAVPSRYVPRQESQGGKDCLTEVLLLIDTSDPARAKDVRAARDIAAKLVEGAPEHYRFGLGVIGNNLTVLEEIGATRMTLRSKLESDQHYAPQNNTRLYWALVEAAGQFKGGSVNTRRVVVVFSDGLAEDNPNGYSSNDAIVASRKNRVGLVTVALVNKVSEEAFANAFKRLSLATSSPAYKLKPQAQGMKYALADDVRARFYEHLEAGGVLHVPRATEERKLKLTLVTSRPTSFEVELLQSATAEPSAPDPVKPPDDGEKDPDAGDGDGDDKAQDPKDSAEESDEGSAEGEGKRSRKPTLYWGLTIQQWIWIGGGVVAGLVLLVVIILMSRRNPAALSLGDSVISGSHGSGTYLELSGDSSVRYGIHSSAARIGRGQDNDIQLSNDSVSKHHAEILRTREGKLLITDLSSGNGVFVNGNRIDSAELFDGDLIELGEVHLIIRNP